MKDRFDIPAELDTPEFREAWDGWIDHRQEMKGVPFTRRAKTLALNELVKLGVDRAVYVIDWGVRKNWRGIHPEHVPDTPVASVGDSAVTWDDSWLLLLRAMKYYRSRTDAASAKVIEERVGERLWKFIEMEGGLHRLCGIETKQMSFLQRRFKDFFEPREPFGIVG